MKPIIAGLGAALVAGGVITGGLLLGHDAGRGHIDRPTHVQGEKIEAGSTSCATGRFCISGSVNDLVPGQSRELVLTLSNPNSFPLYVRSLTVTPGDASSGCKGSANLKTPITWAAIGAGASPSDAVMVPAANGGTAGTAAKTFSVAMLDLQKADQGNCVGAMIPLDYSGDAVWSAQGTTTTSVTAAPDPASPGQPVGYAATVSSPSGTPTGTVSFKDGGTTIPTCASVSLSSGKAMCTVTYNATGNHTVTAVYAGSSDYAASTSQPVGVTVASCTPGKSGCNLSGGNLTNANLTGASFPSANLNKATLDGANLTGTNLNGANLNGTSLRGANLSGANLAGANLNGADLTGANLTGAVTKGANVNKVVWSNTTCVDGTNSDAHGGTCAGHL